METLTQVMDALLQSFVDDELIPVEKKEVLELILDDERLLARVQELLNLKLLICWSYQEKSALHE